MNSQLTTEQHPDFLQSVKAIIMEETDNGRIIVKFLLSAALGEFPDFQPCHQLEAARLLEKYSGQEVKAIINNLNLPPATRRERRDARRADRYVQSELAQIVQQETDNGRTIVTFLVQAMEGELQDFQPCHRMSAAKELLKQGSSVRPEALLSPKGLSKGLPKDRQSRNQTHKSRSDSDSKKQRASSAKKTSSSACTETSSTTSTHSPAPAKTDSTTARATCAQAKTSNSSPREAL